MTFFAFGACAEGRAGRRAGAAAIMLIVLATGCESVKSEPGEDWRSEDWAAHGFMAPEPVGESEIIGLYADRRACERAAREWTERQVAGQPVFADCYPIDKR